VQNAAARLVAGLGPRDRVTPALKTLHWLPVFQRIQYKLCVLAHAAFYKYGPVYLTELLVPVSELPGRSHLRSANSFKFDVRRVKLAVAADFSPSLVLGPGMTCFKVSELHLTT
jgi:hypothetical protein